MFLYTSALLYVMHVNSLHARGSFLSLLIICANNLDLGLDPNCLTF